MKNKCIIIGLIVLYIGASLIPVVNSQSLNTLNSPPTVEIRKPTSTTFWIFGRQYTYPGRSIMDDPAIIIGPLFAEVYAEDEDSGIEKVEFYIDDVLVGTSAEPLSEEDCIYIFPIQNCRIGYHDIKAKAYDNAGNSADTDSIEIFYIGW
jgi:hypothetical protein